MLKYYRFDSAFLNILIVFPHSLLGGDLKHFAIKHKATREATLIFGQNGLKNPLLDSHWVGACIKLFAKVKYLALIFFFDVWQQTLWHQILMSTIGGHSYDIEISQRQILTLGVKFDLRIHSKG